jgi:hypothetical protein
MNSRWIIMWVSVILSHVVAAANAPIQRVDVANMLGSGGSVTAVVVSFSNGVSTPCFTKTLAYLGEITVWAGTGQVCVTPITSVTISPVAGSGGAMYDTPVAPISVSNTLYSTQIKISENTPPIFDSSNGSLLMAGTLQAVVFNNLR